MSSRIVARVALEAKHYRNEQQIRLLRSLLQAPGLFWLIFSRLVSYLECLMQCNGTVMALHRLANTDACREHRLARVVECAVVLVDVVTVSSRRAASLLPSRSAGAWLQATTSAQLRNAASGLGLA